MHMAKFLVQGSTWLDTHVFPWRRAEQRTKATLNGVINLSVLDGWWKEGYNGANGIGASNL